jgi:hypothetical protein
MTIDTVLNNKDIELEIITKIAPQDFPDMRLVCKKWAARGIDGEVKKNWQFMPDSIEQHYDKTVQRYDHCSPLYKTIILWDLVNNHKAVKWIAYRNPFITKIHLQNKWITTPCELSAAMLAIHYNQPKIVRLLIETDPFYENQHWKDVSKTMTIPKKVEECLPHDSDHDSSHNFSFILYLTATFLDDTHNLEKLYKIKKPTDLGQDTIITLCLEYNSIHCFKFLLTKKSTQTRIRKHNGYFFKKAIDYNHPEAAKQLIHKKLFSLKNTWCINGENMTILDFYYKNEEYKNNTQAHTLLRNLGAKTWKELHPARLRHPRDY